MPLHFTKMHGLGNDFMVIDGIRQKLQLKTDNIIAWARRDTGIGFDQCLVVESSKHADVDFFYRIFNANGQEVGQCGNGARCLARFIQKHGLSAKKTLKVSTSTTNLTLYIHDNDSVSVNMGSPIFESDMFNTIPSIPDMDIYPVNIGNPHAVILVEDVIKSDVHGWGKIISEYKFFPQQTNVEFMQIKTKSKIFLRVYERGCGETQACGSGAVAAVVIGQKYHELDDHVTVELPGGELQVQRAENNTMVLTGPAIFVYDGIIA